MDKIFTKNIEHESAVKHVTGKAIYTDDISEPKNLLHAVIGYSNCSKGVIKKIDYKDVLSSEGVVDIITEKDIEGINDVGPIFKGDKIFTSKNIEYYGQPIFAVVAKTNNLAKKAALKVKIDLKISKPIVSIEEALKKKSFVLKPKHLTRGNIKDGFEKSDLIIEREFNLKMVHQGYIEPHNATAHWDENDHLSLWSSTQGQFAVRDLTAGFLDLSVSKVTTFPVEIGGGFGGKTKVYLPPIAAILSKKSGYRPVKMIMDRVSVFQGSGPAPGGKVIVKMGVSNDGKIQSGLVDLKFEAGAFPGSAIAAGSVCCLACYNIPNIQVDAFDVLVNKPKSAAYRAPGSPQVSFAVESVIDEICEKMTWDKIDFRINNASKEGTRKPDGVLFHKIGFIQTLEAAKHSEHWNSKINKRNKNKIYGRGLSCGYWHNGGGRSTVDLMLQDDGNIALNEGSADIGGSRTSISMQVAETLGIPAESIHPSIPDTDTIGFTQTTGGSRTTYATGYAGWQAANKLIEEMKRRVSILWEEPESAIVFDKGIFISEDSKRKIDISELASKINPTGGPVTSTASVNLSVAGNGFGVGICDIEIDPQTGKTDVIKYTAIQDVGKAIYPAYVEGQIKGGAVQGIGWALNEEYYIEDDGSMANTSFLDYRMPTALDMPNIDVILVEVPNPLHPFGVRGVGEVPIVPPLAAVGNAINNAIGKRLFETPMNPRKILEVL